LEADLDAKINQSTPMQNMKKILNDKNKLIDELRKQWHAAVLTRGFAEPQAWFVTPSQQGVPFPLEVTICQRVRAFGLGSAVFV